MLESKLKDPTIWRWQFFLQVHSGDSTEHIQVEHLEESLKALNWSLKWAGSEKQLDLSDLEKEIPTRQYSIRIAKQPWTAHPEDHHHLRSLEARFLLDSIYIESGYAIQTQIIPQDFPILRLARPKDLVTHSFLGEVICLQAELLHGTDETQAKDIAYEILNTINAPTESLGLERVSCGYLGASFETGKEAWALLVFDEKGARTQAEELIHRLMPGLFLARIKGQIALEAFERHLLPEARKLEDQLTSLLEQVENQPRRLNLLEEACNIITHKQTDLAKIVSQSETSFETIKLNVENLSLLLAEPVFAPCRARMYELIVEPLSSIANQISADLRYLSITQTQADRMLQNMEMMTQVRSAQWARRITGLLGLFAIFGVVQAFPEIPWRGRVILVISGIALLSLIIWLLSRKE